MTVLHTEYSFETQNIDDERRVMLTAWENYKKIKNEKMPEVDRVERVLNSASINKTEQPIPLHPRQIVYV